MADNAKNVKIEKQGDRLLIEVDLSKEHGPSKSGRTIIVATTYGNVLVAPGVYLGLNVYKYADGRTK